MEFNPYCEWLAIPPSCIPPSHYRLLGLKDFEPDADKIHQAALAQIARLRVHQAGIHSDLTQKLMNEVSLARVTLCDAGKKEEYDRILRAAVPRASHAPLIDPNDDELLSDDSVEGSSEWELDPENSGAAKSWRTGPIKTVFGVSVATVAFLALIAMALIVGLRRNATTTNVSPPAPDVVVESSTNPPVIPPTITPAVPLPPTGLGQPGQPSSPVAAQGMLPTAQVPPAIPAAPMPPVVEAANPEPAEPAPEEVPPPLAKPKANSSLDIVREWNGPFDDTPWKPGAVVPIQRANTSADESFPFLANNGLDLYFTRRTGRGDEIFCVRRSTPAGPFQQEARLRMPTTEPLNTSASFSADGTCLMFGREKNGQNIMLQAVRSAATTPFTAEEKVEFKDLLNIQGDPFLTSDGLHLVMSAGQGKYARVLAADRPASSGDFPDPHVLELEGSYRRPSITGDLCTIYMEGQLPDGRSAIYRSMRQSVESPWSPPLIVQEIRAKDDTGSDSSPRISNDGMLLLFASTRSGTSGGKDLYAYPLDKPPTVTWPEDSADAPSPPPVDGWMVLGPIPMDVVERISTLTELAKKYFPPRERRDVPRVGDKIAETPWRIADAISGKAGLYLMVFPFEMESTADVVVDVWPPPGGVVLWLDNKEILTLGERKPWSKTGWKKSDCQSSPTQIRKGKHRLYALICAPNDESSVSIDFRFADTNKPVGKMLQLLPISAAQKDR